MPSYAPYSFSKLSTKVQCARKFKYQYIDKVKPEEDVDKTALYKGRAVHSILEVYPEQSTHRFAEKYQPIANKFIKSDLGQKYLNCESVKEVSFGLTHELLPTEYKDKNALFRGYIDFVTLLDNTLYLIDWKTGRIKEQKWQDFSQLTFYAIYFFQKFPTVNNIKISYVYVEHENVENEILLQRSSLEVYTRDLVSLILDLEADTEFKKCPSRLCSYCKFQKHCLSDI